MPKQEVLSVLIADGHPLYWCTFEEAVNWPEKKKQIRRTIIEKFGKKAEDVFEYIDITRILEWDNPIILDESVFNTKEEFELFKRILQYIIDRWY